MPEGYSGLPSYYTSSAGPITPNLGLSLRGMDPVVAEDMVLIDTFAGSAGAIKVNGAVIPSANFNDLLPAAPVGKVNVQWQVIGSDVSAYVTIPAGGVFPQTKAAIASNWLNSYSAVTGLFTATQPTFADLSSHPTTLAGYGITDAISSGVMTTLGDMLYEDANPAPHRLAGNITVTKMYLSQTGNGAISAAPVWAQINYADITGTTPTPPSGSVLWSALGNAAADLTLANGAFNTTIGGTGFFQLGGNLRTGGFLAFITTLLTPPSLAGWVNNPSYPYGTLTSSGANITSAIYAGGGTGFAIATNSTSLVAGATYTVTFTLTLNSGTAPNFIVGSTINGGPDIGGTLFTTVPGVNTKTFTAPSSLTAYLTFDNVTSASNYSISGLTFTVAPIVVDSGISRLDAASLAVGNGTAGDVSGSLALTTLAANGTGGLINLNTSVIGGGLAINALAGAAPQVTLAVVGTQLGAFGIAGGVGYYAAPAAVNDFIVRAAGAAAGGSLLLSTQNATGSIIFDTGINGTTDTAKWQITNAGVLVGGSSMALGWSSATAPTYRGVSTAADAGVSRLGIASLAVGNGTALDFSGSLKLGTLVATAAAPTVAAAQIGYGSTTSATANTTGGGLTLPLLAAGYIIVNIAGTAYKVPYYAS